MDKTSPDFLRVLRAERKDLLNRMRQTRFESLKENYSHSQIIPFASYSPWLDDAAFCDIYEAVKAFTLVDVYRCYALYQLSRQSQTIAGDLVEVGVWRGGTAALLAKAAPTKVMHMFDTFTGVAKGDPRFDTLYEGGEHADTDEQIVKDLFERTGSPFRMHVGLFPDETGSSLPERVALAHIDVDTYRSVKESFDAIWPRVPVGGVVVFDDYGMFGCEGAAQAINEIAAAHPGDLFVHNLNGHAFLAKRVASGN